MISGKYEEMREAYLTYRVLRYLLENSTAKPSKARKYARVAWKRKCAKWRERGLI